MKKVFTLLTMTMMLAFSSQAAYYIVGSDPFGNWDPGNGVEMNANSDGTYSYSATISGTIYFVFASGLDSSWDVFNANYRFGPSGSDQEVSVGQWYATPDGGDKSYKFTGTGSEYVFTFNPAIKRFKIEGNVVPIVFDSFTLAGTPAAIFGTEWDPTNADNDLIKQADGTYSLTKFGCQLAASELAFKVVANHDASWGNAWPAENYVVTVDEPGIYDVTFTFNPDTKEVNATAEKAGSFDPRTGELYILGEVNGNDWNSNVGFKMDTEDGNIFTAEVTTAGENPDENDGIGYSFFSFATKLSENSDEWSSIAGYRIGALEESFLLGEDLVGVELGLGNFGSTYSFKIPAGTWDITVNLDNKTMVFNKVEPIEPEGYKIEKVWEIADLTSFMATGDVRQGFGMNGKVYINNKADQNILVISENGLTNTTYPGGANCGMTRDEAGNIVVSNAAFPGAWTEATIKVINPETNEVKEYTVPEECGLLGRCDFIGFAKGNLMEDGALYLTGGNTNNANGDPFTDGVAILTITSGEVNVDECYTAACDGLVGQTSTVINYFKDINGEDALVYAYRSGNPSKLMFDGDNFTATPIVLPGKGHANGIFPFIWEGKEYYIYPIMPDYQNGFAIAEAGAEEPIVEVPSTVTGNANAFQADWFNAEVDENGVTVYQYYPGGNITVYRLTNGTGAVEELYSDNANKIVAGIRYYNIMGQEMKEANGITIVVTTYTDGSHSAVKVIK